MGGGGGEGWVGVGGGNPLAPVSYAYGWAPSLPPAKSGPGIGLSVLALLTSLEKGAMYRGAMTTKVITRRLAACVKNCQILILP